MKFIYNDAEGQLDQLRADIRSSLVFNKDCKENYLELHEIVEKEKELKESIIHNSHNNSTHEFF